MRHTKLLHADILRASHETITWLINLFLYDY